MSTIQRIRDALYRIKAGLCYPDEYRQVAEEGLSALTQLERYIARLEKDIDEMNEEATP